MAKRRLSMRKIKELLRLRFEHQQSARQIANCTAAMDSRETGLVMMAFILVFAIYSEPFLCSF